MKPPCKEAKRKRSLPSRSRTDSTNRLQSPQNCVVQTDWLAGSDGMGSTAAQIFPAADHQRAGQQQNWLQEQGLPVSTPRAARAALGLRPPAMEPDAVAQNQTPPVIAMFIMAP